MMERTDRPSKDCLLFQNWMSEGETAGQPRGTTSLLTRKRGAAVLTVLEGEELEDAVHDGDDDGETQQVGVGFQQGHLAKGAFSGNGAIKLPGSIREDPAKRRAFPHLDRVLVFVGLLIRVLG